MVDSCQPNGFFVFLIAICIVMKRVPYTEGTKLTMGQLLRYFDNV